MAEKKSGAGAPKAGAGAAKSGTGNAKSSGKKGSDYGAVVVRGEHTAGSTPRYQKKFAEEVVSGFKSSNSSLNVMEIPRLVKIVVNTCQGEATQNVKALEAAATELELITGQKAVITKAKKAISNFKLREGMPIGARVTLRNERAWAFMDRLMNLALPRVRDFRGLPPKGFDGRGNYNLGLKEQIVFPEINYDRVDKVRGMNITICTSAQNDADGRALLEALGMPFRK